MRPEPLRDRRKRLEDEIDGSMILPSRRFSDDGLEAWATVLERGYEGLVAKPEMSAYTPRAGWKKVKVRREGKFIVGGVVQTASGSCPPGRFPPAEGVSVASAGDGQR